MRKIATSKITATSLNPVHCDACGAEALAAKSDVFCHECGEPVSDIESGKTKEVITSSVIDSVEAKFHCNDCKSVIYMDDARSADLLAQTCFCTVCGSSELEPEGSDDSDADSDIPSGQPDVSGGDSNTDDNSDDDDADSPSSGSDNPDDVSADVQDKLSAEVATLEAHLLEFPKPSWVVYNNGKPMFRIERDKMPEVSASMFASSKFIETFGKRAAETSLTAAAKEFKCVYLNEGKSLTAAELENMAYAKMESSALPQLIACVNLAIEGMARNVFSDLNAELKASLGTEFANLGVPNTDAAISAAFKAAGPGLFMKLIAKGIELMNKPDNVREEIQAMVMATAGVVSPESTIDVDQLEIRRRINAGNVPLNSGEPVVDLASRIKSDGKGALLGASVEETRQRLNLRRHK